MARYRKLPVEIEAVQWDGETDGIVERYLQQEPDMDHETESCRHCAATFTLHGWIRTLEGGHIVCPNDWIITGVEGERYPCKPSIFEKTYESAV